MPSADLFHCAPCGMRPAVNLVEYRGKLTRPECLHEIHARQASHRVPAPPPPDHRSDWLIAALVTLPESPDPDASLRRALEAEAAPAVDLGLSVADLPRTAPRPRATHGTPSRRRRSA